MEAASVDGAVLSDDDLLAHADELNATVSRAQHELFAQLREIDRREAWRADGAQSLAQWVSIRYGISIWKAERWVAAAAALETLPLVARAFSSGLLGIDKVVELTRFATPETEAGLVSWAKERASGAIRHRGNLERRRERAETLSAERERYLRWWYTDDGTRLGLEAELPADGGAVVAKALSRLAETVPAMPGDTDHPSPPTHDVRMRSSWCVQVRSPPIPIRTGLPWWCTPGSRRSSVHPVHPVHPVTRTPRSSTVR